MIRPHQKMLCFQSARRGVIFPNLRIFWSYTTLCCEAYPSFTERHIRCACTCMTVQNSTLEPQLHWLCFGATVTTPYELPTSGVCLSACSTCRRGTVPACPDKIEHVRTFRIAKDSYVEKAPVVEKSTSFGTHHCCSCPFRPTTVLWTHNLA